jgi:WbqC-like protein family
MDVAIMQPYFLPYIGYFQLIAAVDRFVIYDCIEYTKKGWINRNRILRNGEPAMFTVPLQNAPDHLQVRQRSLADSFDRAKLRAQFEGAYRKAPEYARVMPLLTEIIMFPTSNLFDYIRYSIAACCGYLGIGTPLMVSSDIESEPLQRGSARVIGLCKTLNADRYTNPIGGLDLYRQSAFSAQGIDLRFLQSRPVPYAQFGAPFQPFLSIADVMMFNPVDRVRQMLADDYALIYGKEEPDVPMD